VSDPEFVYTDATHEYKLVWADGREEILPSVTFIIDYFGFINDFSKQQYAALRGTMAHLAAQYIFFNRLDWSTVDPSILGYCNSLVLWLKLTGFVAEAVEQRLWHPLLKFAGSYDVKGYMPDGSRWIIDLKSGVVAKWHFYQTSAYLILEGGYRRRGSLYLRKSGKIAKFKEHEDPRDEGKFLSMLTIYQEHIAEGIKWPNP
jgi:hypothetical protein